MKRPVISILMISFLLLFGTNLFSQSQLKKSVISGKQIVCYGNQEVHRVYIPPPKGFDPAKKGQGGANFEVEYNDFSDTAKQAFQYAVDIWSTLIKSPVTIRIEANWESLESNVLGNCAPTVFYPGGYLWAPVSDEYYAVALAEKIFGNEINDTSEADLVANFSSGASWYYGTDGNCPGDRYDLVSTVLHEIAHGLGFIGTMGTIGDSLGVWGFDNGKTITFDHWIENGDGERMMNTSIFENPSVALLDEFTSDNLYYNSLIAVLNNAGLRPKLYAPSEFNEGSSIYHLNDNTYLPVSGNSLMTHVVSYGEAVHNPGPIVMGMFADWGWIHTRFDHEPVIDAEDLTKPFTVITKILSDTTFIEDSTFVYYSLDGFTSYDSVKLMPIANQDEFSADIPVPAIDTTIHYYLSTYDYFDRHYTYPPYVPDHYFSFYVGPDTVKPVITHVPVEFTLVSNDSVKFQATVTDNIGIDSVYIEYDLNETEQEPVTMQYDTLNKYSGYMIFSEGTLQLGDSILYRIAAVDSSQNANLTYYPEAGYFKIIVDEIRDVQDAYQNDFDTDSDDFLFTGFSITSPQGFSDTALHTFHPYESPDADDETIEYIAQLKIPIHLKDTDAYMSFDEIVLVEPGEAGTSFGDEEFWDYVVIEGSKDRGKNWNAIEPGYDCKRESFWLTRYNSNISGNNSLAIGTPDLYQYHLVDLLQDDNFSGGDTILIRFRLFSDPYAHGWGWVIDNLKIQYDVSALNDENEILEFSFSEQTGPANINNTDHTISIEVVYGTNLANLVATFNISSQASIAINSVDQISEVTANNFTNPVTYTVIAENGTPQDWIVTVSEADVSVISYFPYSEDFESGNGGWRTGGTNSSWQLGNPAGPTINSAIPGSTAWVTNLTGDYNQNEVSYITSPRFDLSGIDYPKIEFSIWWDAEGFYDGANFQYKQGTGVWKTLGRDEGDDSWYNSSYLYSIEKGFGFDINNSAGWSGDGEWGYGSNGWVTVSHALTSIVNQSDVTFRIAFASNSSYQNDGIAIDSINILNDPTRINAVKALSDIHIYPNPSSGSFTISGTFHQPVKQLNFVITDLVGRQIYSRELLHTGDSFNEQFNITNQPAGLYLVVIRADNQKIVRKLLKSR